MNPVTFRWNLVLHARVPGGAHDSGEGLSPDPSSALSDVQKRIRNKFPSSPVARFRVREQLPDQVLFEIYGGTEYDGMLSITPVTMEDISLDIHSQLPAEGQSVVYHNPRARNNFFGFGAKSSEPALPAITFQEAASRGSGMEKQARSRFNIPLRTSLHFLVKAPALSGRKAVWYFVDSVAANTMDRASAWGSPQQYIDEKDPWMVVVTNLEAYGDPDAQAVVVLDTYADTISGPFSRADVWKMANMGRSPPPVVRRNPKLTFEQAWEQAYRSNQALKTPQGLIVRPVFDESYGPWFADYATGRLLSGFVDGAWEVVPPPAAKRNSGFRRA